MKTKRIGLAYEITSMILVFLIIIGCILPFASITTEKMGIVSLSGFAAEGAGLTYSILAAILLVLIPWTGSNLRRKKVVLIGFGAIFLGLAAGVIRYYIRMPMDPYGYGEDEWGNVLAAELGIGLYLVMIISLGLLIIGAILPTKEKELAQIVQ